MATAEDQNPEAIANEGPHEVTIRLVTQNPVFGYQGKLYEKFDAQGDPRDYMVSADLAETLCDEEDSRFRRVDEDGEVIKSEKDIEAERADDSEKQARTFKVPPRKPVEVKSEVTAKPKTVITTKTSKTAETKDAPAKSGDTDGAVEV
jgi:hypothetical protein